MGVRSSRVAVVGGGPAGLAAAWRLASHGASVVVFESAERVGGRMRTEEAHGIRWDSGVQLLGSMYTATLRVLRGCGAERLVERSPGRDALWRGGRPHEVVYGSPASMLASGALPLSTKLRLGTRYLPFLNRNAGSLEIHAPERAAEAGLDRESIASWGEREIGRDFVEMMAYPLLASFYGTAPEEASAALYHVLARHGTNVQILALHGGAGAFAGVVTEALARAGGEVRTGVQVREVRRVGDGVVLAGEGGEERFDAAVVAVPAPVARDLVSAALPEVAAWLAPVEVRPTATLALLLDHPAGVRWFGLSFPRGESRHVAALCVQENKVDGLVPPGRGAVVVLPTPGAGAKLFEMDDHAAAEALLPEVARVLPGVPSSMVEARLARFHHGWSVFGVGHYGRLATFARGAMEGDARIALAGDYLVAPTVEGAVASGWRAAERIAARLGPEG